jgi:hypothetical protein
LSSLKQNQIGLYIHDESRFQEILKRIENQKLKLTETIFKMASSTREKEHQICLTIWDKVEIEKNCRNQLELYSEKVMLLKAELECMKSKVLYEGDIDMKQTEKFFMSSWKTVKYILTTNAWSFYGKNGTLLLSIPFQNISKMTIHEYQSGPSLVSSSLLFSTANRSRESGEDDKMMSVSSNDYISSIYRIHIEVSQNKVLSAKYLHRTKSLDFRNDDASDKNKNSDPSPNISYYFKLPIKTSLQAKDKLFDAIDSVVAAEYVVVQPKRSNNNIPTDSRYNSFYSDNSNLDSQSKLSGLSSFTSRESTSSSLSSSSLSSFRIDSLHHPIINRLHMQNDAIDTIWEDSEKNSSNGITDDADIERHSLGTNNYIRTRSKSPFLENGSKVLNELMLDTGVNNAHFYPSDNANISMQPPRDSNEMKSNDRKTRSLSLHLFTQTLVSSTNDWNKQKSIPNFSQTKLQNNFKNDSKEENIEHLNYLIDSARDERYTAQLRYDIILIIFLRYILDVKLLINDGLD